MKIIKTVAEMRKELKKQTGTIGFVPTMGFLHQGHLSLVERARKENDVVVLSIFVNPLQFGPNEDYDRYPRDLDRDAGLAEKAGVDFIFHPDVKEMYPEAPLTQVDVKQITERLCGKSPPGSFCRRGHGGQQAVSYHSAGPCLFRFERCPASGRDRTNGPGSPLSGYDCPLSDRP